MASATQLQLTLGQPRTLAYSESIRKDVKLLEVDEALLQELLQTGLCLKGALGEEAVLCSGSKTFAVKNVETTNLVLLVPADAQTATPAAPAALSSQDPNVPPPQATPPGVLYGLGTQLQKNQAAAQHTPVVATALVSSHLELVAAAPRLHQLDALLQERQYGAEVEGGSGGGDMDTDEEPSSSDGGFTGGYTWDQLLARVQCSAAELEVGLKQRKALFIDGRYCSVDAGYQGLLLELVLLTAVEHGWPLSMLPGAEVAAALEPHGYDRRVTLHCLSTFGTPVGSSSSVAASPPGAAPMDTDGAASQQAGMDGGSGGSSGSDVFALDEAAVCLHFAKKLLEAEPDWELAEFEDAWQGSVPEGMLPNLEMLRGEALQYGGGTGPSGLQNPRRIRHLPLTRLPKDAPARFAALFTEQPKWQWEELQPYVQGLQAPGQTAEALLLKYARASQQRPTDPVMYSAR